MTAADPGSDSRELHRAVVVLGMHRSGTSAVAGCLQRLGVDFGPRLMPPNPDNARGFYEHLDVVQLHDRLLLAVDASWDDTDPRPPDWLDAGRTGRFRQELGALLERDFAGCPLWGVKDPRLCRLLSWWEPVWPQLHASPLFVIVLRDPREVAASLARRDGFSLAKGYLLWLLHTLEAERGTRGRERVFLDFGAFLADWPRAFEPVGRALGRPWPVPVPEVGSGGGFVDPALPRSPLGAAEGAVPPWVAAVDRVLRTERGGEGDNAAMREVTDRVSSELEAAQTLFVGTGPRDKDLAQALSASRLQGRWYEEEWQKARRRVETLKEKIEKKDCEISRLKARLQARKSSRDADAAEKPGRQATGDERNWFRRVLKSLRVGGLGG